MASKHGIELNRAQRLLLREGRLLLGLTLGGVGQTVGVSDAAILRYEQGKSRPSAAVLEKWAKALGYEVVWGEMEIWPISKAKRAKRK